MQIDVARGESVTSLYITPEGLELPMLELHARAASESVSMRAWCGEVVAPAGVFWDVRGGLRKVGRRGVLKRSVQPPDLRTLALAVAAGTAPPEVLVDWLAEHAPGPVAEVALALAARTGP